MSPGSSNACLLVVDDDAAVRLVASEMITNLGYDVLVAESGEEALALLKNNVITAVLLDVGMPIMSGMEVYEHLRSSDDRIWVTFMTGYAEEEFNNIDHPHTNVLAKPFSLDDLKAQIAKIFSS